MDKNIAELIRVSLMASPEESSMSRRHIVKTLYLTKNSLPEDNRLIHSLPFYWYKQGPFSKNVYDTIHEMVKSSLLKKGKFTTGPYKLNPDLNKPQVEYDDDMQEAVSTVTETIERLPDLPRKIDEIYKDAPYEWYQTYSMEFMNVFKKYHANVTKSRVGNFEPSNTKTLLESLEGTEYTAPHTQEFFDIRLAHNGFCRICNEVLATEHTHKEKGVIKELMNLCTELWDVFAYKVRILHHDDHYDSEITSWNNKYDKELRSLKEKLESAERVHGDMSHRNIPKYIEDGDVASVSNDKDNSVTPVEFRRMLDDMTV